MIHRFTIIKEIPASAPQVLANYMDIEHIPVHPGLTEVKILSETDSVTCFQMTSTLLGIPFKNIHYFEFKPPNAILQIIKSPLGPMKVLSTVRERTDLDHIQTDVTVETEIDLPAFAYPFRSILERFLRKTNDQVLLEDMDILTRRQRLFGSWIGDYLRDEQPLMCRKAFHDTFADQK